MLTTDTMFAWAWDARPYPDFPGRTAVWHDTPNYELGHWLTGRAGEVPLKWIIAELCGAVGVTGFDTTDLLSASTLVLGYATDSVASPRDTLAGLMDAFQFDARESGGVIAFFAKGNVRTAALSEADLVVDGDQDPGYSFTRSSDTDLPGAVRITYADPFRAYAAAGTEARKAVGNSQNIAAVTTAAALDGAYAADVAATILQQAWAAREAGAVKVPPSRLALEAGDAVTVTVGGATLPFRIKGIETGTYRSLDLVGFEPGLLVVGSPPVASPGPPRPVAFGPPIVEFMELPPVTGQEPELWAPRVAAYASPWSGVDVYRANGGGWSYVTRVEAPATMGELTSPLYPGPVDRWDRGNTVYLRVYGAANLLSLSEAQVLGGGGAIGVKNPDGAWEVLQYQTATLTGPNSYALSKLLRGQLGTEGAMRSPVPAGARVVVLDANALTPLDTVLDNRALAQDLRYGPSLYPVSDPSYAEQTLRGDPIGLKPFSVSQIAGHRDPASGDVTVTWLRRTRFAGDSWDPASVPLNEDAEAYDLEVVSGGAVIRTVPGLTAPAWTYPAAQQVADFGTPRSAYTINVYQLSGLVGRGQGAQRTVFL